MALHAVYIQVRHLLPEDSSLQEQFYEQKLYLANTNEGRTESYEQLFFACELRIADEGECGGKWNQLLCYP